MNRLQIWAKKVKDAADAAPKPLQTPTVRAIAQYDNYNIGIEANHHGVDPTDALALAAWILDVCGDREEEVA